MSVPLYWNSEGLPVGTHFLGRFGDEATLFQLAAQRMKLAAREIVVVGDRLETDIAGGHAFGARTALVLSGVSTRAQAARWRPEPDLIAENLGQLVGV
jgi:ribonucleotide monophosphatase NagD (HAD superfamily)